MSFVALTDFALTSEHIIAWQWAAGDPHIINAVEFAYDWDLAEARGAFGTRQLYTADASVSRYGRRPALQIESRGLKTDSGAQTMLDERAYEVMRRFSEPPPVLVVEVFYSRHLLEPGDQVRVTHPWIPNLRTGLRGLTQETFEVLDMTPQFAGSIRLTLLWVYALATVATPTSGGSLTQPKPVADTTSYREVATAQAFIGTGVQPHYGGAALVYDTEDNAIVYLAAAQLDSDLYLGEASATLTELAALSLLQTGSFVRGAGVRSDFHYHFGWRDASRDIHYLKLDVDGLIVSGPTLKWAGNYGRPAVLLEGSTLYWLLVEDTGATRKLYLATTDTTGAETMAPTEVTSGTDFQDVTACWASNGDLLVFVTKGDRRVDYVRLTTAGALVAHRTSAISFLASGRYTATGFMPLTCWTVGKFLYVVIAAQPKSGAVLAHLCRLTQSGYLVDGPRILESAPGDADGAVYDPTDDSLFVSKTRFTDPTYDVWLTRFTRSGG